MIMTQFLAAAGDVYSVAFGMSLCMPKITSPCVNTALRILN